ncbi:MAG: bifunctional riboflavin kinase/FAD synthetase [Candidatus Dormibacteria bacterium]
MKVHFGVPARAIGPAWMTIGSFDGVHRGHARVVQRLIRRAREDATESVLLTFDPHPRCVLQPDHCPPTLTTVDEKAGVLGEMGVDHLVVMPFTRRVSELSPVDFMRQLQHGVRIAGLEIGYDFALGHQRRGDRGFLEDYGREQNFAVEVTSALTSSGALVSSSAIRALLLEGKVASATRLLGRQYSISSFVEHGTGTGSRIGFPTANIGITPNKLVPHNGVYAVWVDVAGGTYPGAMNVGYRPTFGGNRLTVEAFIFDFDRDVYREEVRVRFVRRIRGERRFESPEALVAQIERDVRRARHLLGKTPPA